MRQSLPGVAAALRPPIPFLRWPGGKRWLVGTLKTEIADLRFNRYIEPFLGGGSVYFGLLPECAMLSDLNAELINTYVQVRDHPAAVARGLAKIKVDAVAYERTRSAKPTSLISQAARFIYLNRTAFSGIYRVNRSGQFNVPYGGGDRNPGFLLRRGILPRAADALSGQSLRCCDFEEALALAGRGDLVYADPTYTVRHNSNGFLRYNERIFSWADQVRLAQSCAEAWRRGAFVLVSNAYHPSIAKLYGSARAEVHERPSLLATDPNARSRTREYLFVMSPRRRGAMPSSS